MTPASFTFKVSVPNDPGLASVVGELARHAADYAKLESGPAAAFADRAREMAATAIAGAAGPCTAVIVAAGGTLTITIGKESTSQPL